MSTLTELLCSCQSEQPMAGLTPASSPLNALKELNSLITALRRQARHHFKKSVKTSLGDRGRPNQNSHPLGWLMVNTKAVRLRRQRRKSKSTLRPEIKGWTKQWLNISYCGRLKAYSLMFIKRYWMNRWKQWKKLMLEWRETEGMQCFPEETGWCEFRHKENERKGWI